MKNIVNIFNPVVVFALGIGVFSTTVVFVIFKVFNSGYKFRFNIDLQNNSFIQQSNDSISKWVKDVERRIKKNNVKIKLKRFLLISVVLSGSTFYIGMKLFQNLTASLLLAVIFLIIPEYMLSLYEDRREKKIEEQMVVAIRMFTAEYIQSYSLQKTFAVLSIKMKDPIGKYFTEAYTNLLIGKSKDSILADLSTELNSDYWKMFIQLIYQVEKNKNIINLFSELIIKIETHIELARTNKASLSGERMIAFIMAISPIPIYFVMRGIVPEVETFVVSTHQGRIVITLSFLSIFVFLGLDKIIRKVE